MSRTPTRSSASGSDAEIELGWVSGIFGVRGEVRLHLHNREGSVLLEGEYPVVLVHPDTGRRVHTTLSARPGAGKRVIGRLADVRDRDEARAWMDWRVRIRTDDLPPLEAGEFWVWQTEGLPVYVGDEQIGEVVDVHDTGPVDVFEIAVAGEQEHRFVPAVEQLVLSLDLDEGRLVLAPAALGGDA